MSLLLFIIFHYHRHIIIKFIIYHNYHWASLLLIIIVVMVNQSSSSPSSPIQSIIIIITIITHNAKNSVQVFCGESHPSTPMAPNGLGQTADRGHEPETRSPKFASCSTTTDRFLWFLCEFYADHSMAGVVLETLSNRKLITLGVILLLIEFVFMLTGGLVGMYSISFDLFTPFR